MNGTANATAIDAAAAAGVSRVVLVGATMPEVTPQPISVVETEAPRSTRLRSMAWPSLSLSLSHATNPSLSLLCARSRTHAHTHTTSPSLVPSYSRPPPQLAHPLSCVRARVVPRRLRRRQARRRGRGRGLRRRRQRGARGGRAGKRGTTVRAARRRVAARRVGLRLAPFASKTRAHTPAQPSRAPTVVACDVVVWEATHLFLRDQ